MKKITLVALCVGMAASTLMHGMQTRQERIQEYKRNVMDPNQPLMQAIHMGGDPRENLYDGLQAYLAVAKRQQQTQERDDLIEAYNQLLRENFPSTTQSRSDSGM